MADGNVVALPAPAQDGGIEAMLATCRIKRLQAMHGLATLIRGIGEAGDGPAAAGPRDAALAAELETMLTRLAAIEIGGGAADDAAARLAEAAGRLQDVHAALMAILARAQGRG